MTFPFPFNHRRKVKLTVNAAELLSGVSNLVLMINEAVLPDEVLDSDGLTAPRTNGEDIRISLDEEGLEPLPLHVLRHAMNSTPANAKVDYQTRVPDLSANQDTDLYIWWDDSTETGDAQPGIDDPEGKHAVYQDCWWAWNFYEDPTASAPQCLDDAGNGIDLDVLSGAGVPTLEDTDDDVGQCWLFSASGGTRCRVPSARFYTPFIGTNGFSVVARLHHTVNKAASQNWILFNRGGHATTGNGAVSCYWNTGFADGYSLDFNPANSSRSVRLVNDHDETASIMFSAIGTRSISYKEGSFSQVTDSTGEPDWDDADSGENMNVGSQGYPGEYLDGQWVLNWVFSDQKSEGWFYAHTQNWDDTANFFTVGTPTDAALQRSIVFDGLDAGSEVRIFHSPHATEVSIDCVADVAGSLNDTYFTLGSINGTPADVEYYVWFNVNGAGTDPSLAGRTGIEVELDTNDSAADVATTLAAALDGDSLFTASEVGSLVTYTCANNGEAELPVDYGTGVTFSLIKGGGTLTTEIDGVENSTGTSYTATYDVLKPFEVFVQVLSLSKENVSFRQVLDTSGLVVPAGALQRTDRVYENPA